MLLCYCPQKDFQIKNIEKMTKERNKDFQKMMASAENQHLG